MATRLYTPGPSAEELAAIGLRPEDVADDSVVEVWEENWVPFLIFNKLRTQWRVGMNGPTGMDYSLLPMLLTMFRVKPKRESEILDSLIIMETTALNVMLSKD